MKQVAAQIASFTQDDIAELENTGYYEFDVDDTKVAIGIDDVEIVTEDIPGWVVSALDSLTVALDVTITNDLKQEGIARELVNRIQNLRKDKKLEVTDKIELQIEKNEATEEAIQRNISYICSETLATKLLTMEKLADDGKVRVELYEDVAIDINIIKQN